MSVHWFLCSTYCVFRRYVCYTCCVNAQACVLLLLCRYPGLCTTTSVSVLVGVMRMLGLYDGVCAAPFISVQRCVVCSYSISLLVMACTYCVIQACRFCTSCVHPQGCVLLQLCQFAVAWVAPSVSVCMVVFCSYWVSHQWCAAPSVPVQRYVSWYYCLSTLVSVVSSQLFCYYSVRPLGVLHPVCS